MGSISSCLLAKRLKVTEMESIPKVVCVKMAHPKYGFLMSDPEFWESGSEKWLSGYWGPTWIFANLMVAEIELSKAD